MNKYIPVVIGTNPANQSEAAGSIEIPAATGRYGGN